MVSVSVLLVAPDRHHLPAAATAETLGESSEAISSWSDARIVAELAKDCAFNPDELKGARREEWLGPPQMGSSSPLSCSAAFEQSCTYDPCFEEQQTQCHPRCGSTCRQCGKGCATKCESCKSQCKDKDKDKDAACRMSCARSCATCHEGCVRQRDRCATGSCTAEYRQCRLKLKSSWAAKGCPKVCRGYLQCQERCAAKIQDHSQVYDKCVKPCQPADKKGCDIALCGGEFGMGIDPTKYPESD